jgi:lipopolysaccharide export LptBFGC system permease protein LptF
MNETVSVDEAISKGHKMINYPVLVIMFGTIGLTLYLGTQNLVPDWGFPVGFVLAFVFAWLWWEFYDYKVASLGF